MGTYEFVGRRARGNKVIVNRVGMKGRGKVFGTIVGSVGNV